MLYLGAHSQADAKLILHGSLVNAGQDRYSDKLGPVDIVLERKFTQAPGCLPHHLQAAEGMDIKHEHPELCCGQCGFRDSVWNIMKFQVKEDFFPHFIDSFNYPGAGGSKQFEADLEDLNVLLEPVYNLNCLFILRYIKGKYYAFFWFQSNKPLCPFFYILFINDLGPCFESVVIFLQIILGYPPGRHLIGLQYLKI